VINKIDWLTVINLSLWYEI